MALTMEIKQQRRTAEINLPAYWARKYELVEGPTPCYVLGIFQETTEDGAEPVAVCELYSGHVISVSADRVKFVDTDEMGVIK